MPKQRRPHTPYHVPPEEPLPAWATPPAMAGAPATPAVPASIGAPASVSGPAAFGIGLLDDLDPPVAPAAHPGPALAPDLRQLPPPAGRPLSIVPPKGPAQPPAHPLGHPPAPPGPLAHPPAPPGPLAHGRPPGGSNGGLVAVFVVVLVAIGVVAYLAVRPHSSLTTAGGPASATGASPSYTPDLNAEALSPSDMPSGWVPAPQEGDGGGGDGGGGGGCRTFDAAASSGEPVEAAKAEASFAAPPGQEVDEELSYYQGDGAIREMSRLSQELTACPTVTISTDVGRLTGPVVPIHVQALGNQTAGWAIALHGFFQGRPVALSEVMEAVRINGTLLGVIYTSLGPPDVTTAYTFAHLAATKVS